MYYTEDYCQEAIEEKFGIDEDSYPSKPDWMLWLIYIGLAIILGTILFGCEGPHMATAFFAFFNTAIVAFAIYKFAKSIRNDVLVGSALSFKGIYNPFYRARQDLQGLSKYSDFLKIVMYYNVGGARMNTFINRSGKTLYGDMDPQRRLDFVNSIMGYEDSRYENLEKEGLPFSMIERETKRALEGARGTPTTIWPAIDIDLPARRSGRPASEFSKCTPESTKNAVKAVFNSGAKGIILARKYSEMNLSNLKGVGEALKEL